jgi:DNA modification methylase
VECGDSHQLITTIPDHSIDLILTDPPYNLAHYSTGPIKLSWRKDIHTDIAYWDQQAFIPAEWHHEFARVLNPSGNVFVFTSHNLFGKWYEALSQAFDTVQFVIWHKTNPIPKIRRAGFLNSCELVICCWNKGHTWNFGKQRDMHNFIQTTICMGHERLKDPHHPTQKPVRLLQRFIEWESLPGDTVFDPFMGVGSTGVAASSLDRKFIGFDQDATYVTAARNRITELKASSPRKPKV